MTATPAPRPYRCACGEAIVQATWEGDRGICELRGMEVVKTVAPLTIRCLQGHTQELWMTKEEALPWFEQVMVIGR